MTDQEIPDYNVFMMCERLNAEALTDLNENYTIRKCRREDLPVWKAFPFDAKELAQEYDDFMTQFFEDTYGGNQDLFFENTLFVCDKNDQPIATCSSWKAYGKINTIQWFKTRKDHEGKGIGRALLSVVMKRFVPSNFPIFLHTQPGSYRAIKLYSDFGFCLLKGAHFCNRTNDFDLYLPILQKVMLQEAYNKLSIVETPTSIIEALKGETSIQF